MFIVNGVGKNWHCCHDLGSVARRSNVRSLQLFSSIDLRCRPTHSSVGQEIRVTFLSESATALPARADLDNVALLWALAHTGPC